MGPGGRRGMQRVIARPDPLCLRETMWAGTRSIPQCQFISQNANWLGVLLYYNSIYSKSPKSNQKQLLQFRIQIIWNVDLSLQGPQLSKGQAKESQYACSKAELSRKGGGWRVWALGQHHGRERKNDGASLLPAHCNNLKTPLQVVHTSNGICSAPKEGASEIWLSLNNAKG